MLIIIPGILICLLALYGAIALSIIVINSIFQRVKSEKSKLKLILLVKDNEEAIEGIIRNIFAGNFLRKVIPESKLTVLDMGSTDETLKILGKLKCEYEQLELLSMAEKDNAFEGFEENK